MPYFTKIVGTPVLDAEGEKIGTVNDLGATMSDVFPRVTSLAFQGPSRTPFMISWRKYVESCDDDAITLNVKQADVRFSYLQPNELLLGRDLMNKQVVDTKNTKVVRVRDLKLSATSDGQLRLLGAEVGTRGRLRLISPRLEGFVTAAAKALGNPIPERVIAWSNMDLVDGDSVKVKLASTHRSIEDMHPADIAEIVEQLDPELRAQVFRQLDTDSAADAMSELDDEYQVSLIGELPEDKAAAMIAEMDPDDAADIIGELPYDKAERLLKMMSRDDEKAIRALLGYPKDTAGGIMTSEFVALPQSATIADVRKRLRALDEDFEPVYYIYTLSFDRQLVGVLSMRDVVNASDDQVLGDLSFNDLITVSPETDQKTVVEEMSKYNLVDLPVVDAENHLLGIVSVDDALDVLEEGTERDRELATGTRSEGAGGASGSRLAWFLRRELWFIAWVALTLVASIIFPREVAVPIMAFLPIVLLVADDTLPFAVGYVHDGDDEARPTTLGLVVRNLAVGLVMGCLGWALVNLAMLTGAVPFDTPSIVVDKVLAAGMVTVAVLVTGTTFMTRALERRAESERPTPGIAASLTLMVVAAVVFGLLTALFLQVA